MSDEPQWGLGNFRLHHVKPEDGGEINSLGNFLLLFPHCPQDHARYYFRAQPGAPDFFKCLTRLEKGYHEDLVVIVGKWNDGHPY